MSFRARSATARRATFACRTRAMRAGGLRLPQITATIGLPSQPSPCNPHHDTQLRRFSARPFRHFRTAPCHAATRSSHLPRSSIRSRCISTKRRPRARCCKGLSGSGWHLCSIMMRMMFDGYIGRTASLGSPGVNEVALAGAAAAGRRPHARYRCHGGAGFQQPSGDRHRDLQGRGAQRGRAGTVRDGLADHRAAARRAEAEQAG